MGCKNVIPVRNQRFNGSILLAGSIHDGMAGDADTPPSSQPVCRLTTA